MYTLISLIYKLEYIIEILILIRILLSWIAPYTNNYFTDTIYFLTEPILSPFRNLISFGRLNIDISPILAIFVIRFVIRLIIKGIILFLA